MNTKDNVADLIRDGEWLWPTDWVSKFPELQHVTVPLISDDEDKTVWVDTNGNGFEYSTKVARECLRDN